MHNSRLRLDGIEDLLVGNVVEDQLAAIRALWNVELGNMHGNELAFVEAFRLVGDRCRPHFFFAAPGTKPGKRSARGWLDCVGLGFRHL